MGAAQPGKQWCSYPLSQIPVVSIFLAHSILDLKYQNQTRLKKCFNFFHIFSSLSCFSKFTVASSFDGRKCDIFLAIRKREFGGSCWNASNNCHACLGGILI